MKSRTMLAIVALALAVPVESGAIVIRHDTDDARYVELGRDHPAVGGLVPLGDGVVTLIDPRWAITAAHVADGISPFVRAVRFGDGQYRIARVYLHPTWDPDMSLETIDIALLELTEPVRGVEPAGLYRGSAEERMTVTFVGWGDTGTGETGPEDNDGKKRGATNEVSDVLDGWVKFLFDAPPGGTATEGISGPGDSGGPALAEIDGRSHVVGLSSFNDDMGTGIEECRYGSAEFYARVSTSIEWIDGTMKDPGSGGRTWNDPQDFTDGWPATPAGKLARSFYRAYAAGSAKAMEKFVREYRSAEALEKKSTEERVVTWMERRERWGELEVARWVADGERDIYVLTGRKADERWFNYRFRLVPEGKPVLDFISIGWDLPPAGR